MAPDLDEQIAQGIPEAKHLRWDLNLLAALGIQAQAVLRRGDPAGEVLSAATDFTPGIIIVGAALSDGVARGGEVNVAIRILQQSPCPVAIFYSRLV